MACWTSSLSSGMRSSALDKRLLATNLLEHNSAYMSRIVISGRDESAAKRLLATPQ